MEEKKTDQRSRLTNGLPSASSFSADFSHSALNAADTRPADRVRWPGGATRGSVEKDGEKSLHTVAWRLLCIFVSLLVSGTRRGAREGQQTPKIYGWAAYGDTGLNVWQSECKQRLLR